MPTITERLIDYLSGLRSGGFHGISANVQAISSNTTLVEGSSPLVWCDVRSAAVTVTLPASPAVGSWFRVVDDHGAAATHNITVARNGNTIDRAAANVTISTANDWRDFYFDGAGWVTSGLGITAKAREQLLAEAEGFLTESTLRTSAVSTAAVAGTIYLIPLAVRAGVTYTNLVVNVNVAGSGETAAYVAFYDYQDTANRLIAASADIKASLESGTGNKTLALGATYTPTVDGVVYGALLCVGGTPPTLARLSNQSTQGAQQAANKARAFATGGTGQATLGTTITVADGTIQFWMALT